MERLSLMTAHESLYIATLARYDKARIQPGVGSSRMTLLTWLSCIILLVFPFLSAIVFPFLSLGSGLQMSLVSYVLYGIEGARLDVRLTHSRSFCSVTLCFSLKKNTY